MLATALAVLFLAAARDAPAYCRTAACPSGTGTRCEPPLSNDCGVPLHWPSPCVGFSVQEDASERVSYERAVEILDAAFAAWLAADCGGGPPRLAVYDLGPVACRRHEYNANGGNANVVIFHDGDWPHPDSPGTLALTTVTYHLDTGVIHDADIEVNVPLATGGAGIVLDLRFILTHEVGHFLGLAHSPLEDTTMFERYHDRASAFSALHADDVAAICAAYPRGDPIPETCTPTPRNGFAVLCASETRAPEPGCCSIAPGSPAENASRAAALGAGALALSARRRARRVTPSARAAPGRGAS